MKRLYHYDIIKTEQYLVHMWEQANVFYSFDIPYFYLIINILYSFTMIIASVI